MRTSQDIYAEYEIMPSLQLHQLRVAAVGKLLCEHFQMSVEKHTVVVACLFHDMGNIIKSDLTLFPEFRVDKGIEYWEKIKKDFLARYGKESHAANTAIAKEIGLPEPVVSIIDSVGFSSIPRTVESDSFELKICQYADTRVGPYGVLTVRERIEEGYKRYSLRAQKDNLPSRDTIFENTFHKAEELEKQIFDHTSILPEDINDSTVDPLIEELRSYPVP